MLPPAFLTLRNRFSIFLHTCNWAGGREDIAETPWPSSFDHHFGNIDPQGFGTPLGVSYWEKGKEKKLILAREV